MSKDARSLDHSSYTFPKKLLKRCKGRDFRLQDVPHNAALHNPLYSPIYRPHRKSKTVAAGRM